MGFVRTILGDILPKDMGFTYSHEHIVIDQSYPTQGNPDFLLGDLTLIIPEILELSKKGVKTMVDTMPINAGRNVLKLVEISKACNIQIIAPTGIHLGIYYPKYHWQFQYTEDEITRLLIDDVTLGIDEFDYNGPIVKRTEHKAGLVKFASGNESFNKHEQKLISTVLNCHLETHCPILTHTNQGLQALEQAEFFIKNGGNKDHIVLSHVDRNHDLGYINAVLETGVSLEFDSAFRWGSRPNNTYKVLEKLLGKYPKQFCMGMDAARSSYWRSFGGSPGLDFLLVNSIPKLKEMGLGHLINNIFIENPKRIFSFY
jgi:5-phospho-D-xylono-1,4-lactonase